jgi:hypothetical protein
MKSLMTARRAVKLASYQRDGIKEQENDEIVDEKRTNYVE